MDLLVYPLHELFNNDPRDMSGMLEEVSAMADRKEMPDVYYANKTVREHGSTEFVWPWALFIDGVAYSNHDSCIGWWLHNVLTGTRFLFCALRKAVACRCACRGWCTFSEVFRFIKWSLFAMQNKLTPNTRHDFLPWTALDVKCRIGASRAELIIQRGLYLHQRRLG